MDQATVRKLLTRARKALVRNPNDMQLHKLIAPLYEQMEQYALALPHLAFLLKASQFPEADAYSRYAKALLRTGAFSKARTVLDDGLGRFADSPVLLKSKALVCGAMGDFEGALQTYQRLAMLDASDQLSLGMAGATKMLLTDLREGIEEYDRRPQDKAIAGRFDAVLKWAGESLAGKRVVVWSEQGIGDVIMFIGLLPWLVAQKASVSLVITSKLAPLVCRSFPEIGIVSESGLKTLDVKQFDCHLPIGSLIRYALPHYRPADNKPYLVADTEKSERLRESYRAYALERGRTYLVGISWHTTNPQIGFTQNVGLPDWRRVLEVPGVQFVSLQYGDHTAEIADCNRVMQDVLLSDPEIDAFNDIDGLAAQIQAMDEVVTISNVTVHLAGSLGVPTTFMLSAMPDWRWGLAGSDNRWYKSVFVERQEKMLDWRPVIERVRERLTGSKQRTG